MVKEKILTSVPNSSEQKYVGTLNCSSEDGKYTYTITPISVDNDQGYSFSIWLKSSVDTSITIDVLGTSTTFAVTTEWKKFEKVITSSTTSTIKFIVPSNYRGTLYMYEGMLSKGDAIADWEIAYEDFATTTDTIINGGNVTTGTITSASYLYSDDPNNADYNDGFSKSGMGIDLDHNIIITPYFILNDDGAKFKGTVIANSGDIGGFNITEDGFVATYDTTGEILKINSYPYDPEAGIPKPFIEMMYMNGDDVDYFTTISSARLQLGTNKRDETNRGYYSVVDSNSMNVYYGGNPSSGIVPTTVGEMVGNDDERLAISSISPLSITEAGQPLEDKYVMRNDGIFFDSGAKTVTTKTGVTTLAGNFQMPTSGIWYVQMRVSFPSNENGRRIAWFTPTKNSDFSYNTGENRQATSGATTAFSVDKIQRITTRSSSTLSAPFYIYFLQNSGSSLEVSYRIYAYRLGDLVDTRTLSVGIG